MFTLRCTQRLLHRIPGAPLSENAKPTTLLGDWYANLLFPRAQQMVLCISERTLLPLIVPAKDARYLIDRMAQALPEVLSALAIESTMIQRETSAMRMELKVFGRRRFHRRAQIGQRYHQCHRIEWRRAKTKSQIKRPRFLG